MSTGYQIVESFTRSEDRYLITTKSQTSPSRGTELDVRSVSIGGTFSASNTLGKTNKLTFNDFIKVWSDGNGDSVTDLISLK